MAPGRKPGARRPHRVRDLKLLRAASASGKPRAKMRAPVTACNLKRLDLSMAFGRKRLGARAPLRLTTTVFVRSDVSDFDPKSCDVLRCKGHKEKLKSIAGAALPWAWASMDAQERSLSTDLKNRASLI